MTNHFLLKYIDDLHLVDISNFYSIWTPFHMKLKSKVCGPFKLRTESLSNGAQLAIHEADHNLCLFVGTTPRALSAFKTKFYPFLQKKSWIINNIFV